MDYSETKELVLSAGLGEREALEALFNSTCRRSYFIALSVAESESSTLYILYDSYYSALKGIADLKHPERFERWMNQIVANRCAGVIRDYQPDIFADADVSMAGLWEPEDADIPAGAVTFNRKQAFASMTELIGTLPLDVRLCLILHYYAKLTPGEIAYSIGASEDFVRDRLCRASLRVSENSERFAAAGVDFSAVTPMALVALTLMSYSREAFSGELAACVMSDIMLMLDGAPVEKLRLGVPESAEADAQDDGRSLKLTIAIVIAAAIIIAGTAIGISIAGSATDPLGEVSTSAKETDAGEVEDTLAAPERVTDPPTKHYYGGPYDDDDDDEEPGTVASTQETTETTEAETTTGTTGWKESLSSKIDEGLSGIADWFTTEESRTRESTSEPIWIEPSQETEPPTQTDPTWEEPTEGDTPDEPSADGGENEDDSRRHYFYD